MGEFRMPSLGADMEAGTLVEWLKRPGDAVRHGDVVAVVETQKGAIEIEVFEDGTLERLLVEPGIKVPVGTPLAWIRSAGDVAATPAAAPRAATEPARPAIAIRSPAPVLAPPGTRPRASPAARRLAAERGIDLAAIAGTGPDGAVVSVDLDRTPPAARTPPARRGRDPAEMRKAIAAAMARSKREIPHYYLSHSIDLTRSQAWLEEANAGRPPAERLLLAALLLRAVALAAAAHPGFNGFYVDDVFRPSERVHVGTAIAIRGGGLTAPALHDVDRLSVGEVMTRLRDLVTRARAGSLRGSELMDPTITVTSLGERGVEGLFGVIHPPQVAIVGFGTPAPRPRVVEGRVEPRPVMTTTLAADHRVTDGHLGALFLAEIERRLLQPEAL